MKSYVDLEQSKKLMEILPLESADYFYMRSIDNFNTIRYTLETYPYNKGAKDHDLPCWSLAVLLEIIPKRIKEDNIFRIDVGVKDSSIWYDRLSYGVNSSLPDITADNLVDACYYMIIRLHELKLL